MSHWHRRLCRMSVPIETDMLALPSRISGLSAQPVLRKHDQDAEPGFPFVYSYIAFPSVHLFAPHQDSANGRVFIVF